ncbi:hypothetical protein K474DRAFT_1776183 [Panus rudis PR-1116 ss-1]|nr:hypothetical protein K474DRAFT_1776183 [Panus rudis PR-1116 ss-1]
MGSWKSQGSVTTSHLCQELARSLVPPVQGLSLRAPLSPLYALPEKMPENISARRTSWLFLILGRTKRLSSPDYTNEESISWGELKFLYTQAVRERVDAFESARRRYELEFLQAEIALWKVEDARDEIFDTFLAEIRETFLKSHEPRVTVYTEMEVRHDEICRLNEEKRSSMFRQAIARRESEYRKAPEEMVTKSVVYAHQRAQVFEQGRKRRKEVYDAMFRLAGDTFKKIMRDAEEECSDARGDREMRVRKRLEELQETRDRVKEDSKERMSYHPPQIAALKAEVDEPSPPAQRDISSPSESTPVSWIPSNTTRPHPPCDSHRSDDCVIPVILRTRPSSPSPSRSFSKRRAPRYRGYGCGRCGGACVDICSGRILAERDLYEPDYNPWPGVFWESKNVADGGRYLQIQRHEREAKQWDLEKKKQKSKSGWLLKFWNPEESLFVEEECKRHLKHRLDLLHWTESIFQGEDQRDHRILERRIRFNQLKDELDEAIFLPAMRRFVEQFSRREGTRQTAERERVEESDAAREHFRSIFEHAQAQYEAEYHAASEGEVAYMQHHEERIQHLIMGMDNELEALQSSFGEAFAKEMKMPRQQMSSFEPDLSAPSEWVAVPEWPRIPSSRSSFGNRLARSYLPPRCLIRVPRPLTISPERRRRPYSSPPASVMSYSSYRGCDPQRSLSSEESSVPRTLFRSDGVTSLLNPRDYLNDSEASWSRPLKSLSGTRLSYMEQLARHKDIYEWGAAQREADVQSLQRKHQEEFTNNDIRRQVCFLTDQKTMRESAAAREARQAYAFDELLRSQESSFEESEKRREAAFLSGEREREEGFWKLQRNQEDAFRSVQLRLLSNAYEEELEREKELITWRVGLERDLRNIRKEWEERFYEDEQKREEFLVTILLRMRQKVPAN